MTVAFQLRLQNPETISADWTFVPFDMSFQQLLWFAETMKKIMMVGMPWC
jgi:hypothetical protein